MRNLSIDVLKIILAFFVVFLHMHILKDSYPLASFILVNGVFRIAVPAFLIITGYYFYHIDTVVKLKKWLIRTFLLYAVWSIIYIPFWEDDQILSNILFGYHHLWYLIGAFFSGIILFILRKKSVVFLSVSGLFLFSIGYILQLLGNFHYFKGELDTTLNLFPSYRNFLFVCFPFLTMGYLINKQKIDKKYKPSLIFVIGCAGLVIFESFLNYKLINSKENVDLLISLLPACSVLFLYCKNLTINISSKILASLSTAIYLVHPLLMKLMPDLHIQSYETIVFLAVLLIVSVALVYANRKLKYLL
ncbi:hypothetical protein M2347_002769 [Chryseobacterium sp. H1D6B]|uniref:acyltransferase family protein n=1 Tax=Chryseobacterium sp. H1D6B TaxID=2940588 RepID=UPI0015CC7E9E|nr:acyltransferase family protein [Chryseobacterium sp. H1D6B]MDH6253042.1 hypothetical protein [Chryseobacterium sp. H1D6B]